MRSADTMLFWKLLLLAGFVVGCAASPLHADDPRSASDFDIVRVNWSIPLRPTSSIPSVTFFEPVSSRPEILVLQDGSRLRAINPTTGAAAWPVHQGDAGDLLHPGDVPLPFHSGEQLTASTWVGLVSGEMLGTRIDRLKIVCLDLAQEGRVLWTRSATELMQQYGWSFTGELIAHRGIAYVSMRAHSTPRELAIAALDSQGTVRWIRRVTIRETGSRIDPETPLKMIASETGHLLVLFTPSQVTILNSLDGSDHLPSLNERVRTPARGETTSVTVDGLVQRDVVIRLSGRDIDAWSLSDGHPLWTNHLEEPATSLIGVSGDILLVGGESLNGVHIQTGRRVWRFRSAFPAFQGAGQGVLIDNRLLWPTRDELWIVAPETGATIRRHSLKAVTDLGGGSVTLRHGKLLICSPDHCTSYDLRN